MPAVSPTSSWRSARTPHSTNGSNARKIRWSAGGNAKETKFWEERYSRSQAANRARSPTNSRRRSSNALSPVTLSAAKNPFRRGGGIERERTPFHSVDLARSPHRMRPIQTEIANLETRLRQAELGPDAKFFEEVLAD